MRDVLYCEVRGESSSESGQSSWWLWVRAAVSRDAVGDRGPWVRFLSSLAYLLCVKVLREESDLSGISHVPTWAVRNQSISAKGAGLPKRPGATNPSKRNSSQPPSQRKKVVSCSFWMKGLRVWGQAGRALVAFFKAGLEGLTHRDSINAT